MHLRLSPFPPAARLGPSHLFSHGKLADLARRRREPCASSIDLAQR